MMIRMKTYIAGAGFSAGPGDEVDIDKDEALRMISAGYATEIAVTKPTENAMKRAPQARRKGNKNG